MQDQGENKADNAYNGKEEYFTYGTWGKIEERKVVVFRGEKKNASCYAMINDTEYRVEACAQGVGTSEFRVREGESVYAMNAFIFFKDDTG